MWALSMLVGPVASLSWVYGISALILGAWFNWGAFQLWRKAQVDQADVAGAMKLLHFSITYLTVLFVMMAVDVLIRHH